MLYHTNPARCGGRSPAEAALAAGGAAATTPGDGSSSGTGPAGVGADRAVLRAGGTGRAACCASSSTPRAPTGCSSGARPVAGASRAVLAPALGLRRARSGGSRRARSGSRRRIGRRQEELSRIGQMTATLAHEIRNAIGGDQGPRAVAGREDGPPATRASASSARDRRRPRGSRGSSASCSATRARSVRAARPSATEVPCRRRRVGRPGGRGPPRWTRRPGCASWPTRSSSSARW